MIEVETVVVALVSGAVGALLTTLLRIRHEREERYRERQLTAADDFSTGVIQAMRLIRDAHGDRSKIPAAREGVAAAHDRQARIDLLFGNETAPGQAAADVLGVLHATSVAVAAGTQSDDEQYARLWEAWFLHEQFNGAARAVARRTYFPVSAWRTYRDAIEKAHYEWRRDRLRYDLEQARVRAAPPQPVEGASEPAPLDKD